MTVFSKITTGAVGLFGCPVTAVLLRGDDATRTEEIDAADVVNKMLPRIRHVKALAVVSGAKWLDVGKSKTPSQENQNNTECIVPKTTTAIRANSLVGVNRFVLRLIFSFLQNPRSKNIINATYKDGETLLIRAAWKGCLPVVQEILSCDGIDVNKSDTYGRTALCSCVGIVDLPVVQELLSFESIDVNKGDELGYTPLMGACANGKLRVVRELLSCESIDVNKGNIFGSTALIAACSYGHLAVVQELLSFEGTIDVNKSDRIGKTALIVACVEGKLPVVQALLSHEGIDVHATNQDGRTALYVARDHRHKKIEKFLKPFYPSDSICVIS